MITIRRARSARDFQHAALLIGELHAWIRRTMEVDITRVQPGFGDELTDPSTHYHGTTSALFLAVRDGQPLGCVAVRCHPDGHAELKRMFVRPDGRRAGVGGRLVEHVVRFAAKRGAHSVWLETARGAMDPAIAMYQRHGFTIAADESSPLAIDNIVVMRRPLGRRGRRDHPRSDAIPR